MKRTLLSILTIAMLALSVPSDAMANEGNIEWADLDVADINLNYKVKLFHTSLLIIFCCLMFCSCHDKVPNSNFQLSLDEFKNSRSSAYAIN